MERSRFKMFSDPVHGFISVPKGLLMDLVQTPEVQRLRRIRQLGLGHMVFTGAEHSRFSHALGAMALMGDALTHLADKGTPVSPAEYEGALIAALLHDLGHGPFSHTLEHALFSDFHHEQMSRALMDDLNMRFDGRLSRALEIFDNTYERPFFHQLVSSQLDMDRLDYLRRDSFFTGVAEGVVGVERIIKTMRVHPIAGGGDARLMVERKGQYAVENYLIARRLMYWQVYLHKTALAADFLLHSLLMVWKTLPDEPISPALRFFLTQNLTGADVQREEVRKMFCALDDLDVEYSIKQWTQSAHPVMADLANRFVHRRLFRVAFLEEPPTEAQRVHWRAQLDAWLDPLLQCFPDQADLIRRVYFLETRLRVQAYGKLADTIQVVDREDRVTELSAIADSLIHALSQPEEKTYICFPKELTLAF